MSKKGFLKVMVNSVEGIKNKNGGCVVKMHALDTNISIKVSELEKDHLKQFYLPITDKIQIQLHANLENIGYFELPIKKIYDFPTKKHSITVNCITKNVTSRQINPDVFGVVKLSLKYFQNHVGKLDILIDRVEEQSQGKSQDIFVQCIVGNVSSQTTLKTGNQNASKAKEILYQWKQLLPFTLQSIPGKIQLLIKEKDMKEGQTLGKITLDPQSQGIFEQDNNKADRRYQIINEKHKIIIHLSKIFTIPENQV